MAVQKLTVAQKELIRVNYTSKRMNITEMAKALDVSTRTIGRVLEELDLASPRQTMRGDAYLVMQELRKRNIKPEELWPLIDSMAAHGKIDRINNALVYVAVPINASDVILYARNLDDGLFQALLTDIIQQREAHKHSVHVQTAMLNLNEKAEKNVRDTKEGRS